MLLSIVYGLEKQFIIKIGVGYNENKFVNIFYF